MADVVDFTRGYVRRIVDDELDTTLGHLPAILIDGPKAVGKTASAEQRHGTRYQLDDAAQLQIIQADTARIANDTVPVLIDEWHLHPDVWSTVKRAVDSDRSPGRFILTGSAPSPEMGLHSGAARISTVRMRPLSLAERLTQPTTVSLGRLLLETDYELHGSTDVTLDDYVDEILRGGFPGLRNLPPHLIDQALDQYVDRVVTHDFEENGLRVRRPEAVKAWMRGYAAATATTAGWDKIRDSTVASGGPKTRKGTLTYIELLKQLRILDSIPAWTPTNSHFKRHTGAEKHHLADPSLAARLLRLTRRHLLTGKQPEIPVPRDGAILGNLFESLTALTIRVAAQAANASVSHLRTQGGAHEVDFIIESDHGIVGVEVKLAATIDDNDVKHLLWLKDKLGDDCINLAIVTTGTTAYRRADGIAVIPLALLGP